MTAVLSVDVGGTKTVFGAIAFDGTVRGETLVPTRIGSDDVLRVAVVALTVAVRGAPILFATAAPILLH